MLKFKIDKETFETLDDNLKTLYAELGDGYQLQVDGVADPAEVERLRSHSETLLAEKKAKAEQARQYEAEKIKAEQEAAMKAGDLEKLKASMAAEIEKERNEKLSLIEQRNNGLINNQAQSIASELTDNPKNQQLLQHFIKSRLNVNEGAVQTLDADGNAIDATSLINEFKTCGLYDSLITGTRASGTGGSGNSSIANKSPSEMTEQERLELKRSNPEQFKQLFNIS